MSNNRPVGLSMLPAHVGASGSTFAALQREFTRLRALEHPHIARMLELGHNGQQYYVTGERLDGEPLREVLTHLLPERLDVGEADDVVRAIGSALAYAHALDVAHGDVRAENVIVTMDRRVMLTNFLARRVAKVSGRPPRESDDLTGLARLAAELYTGSTSPQALRAAVHGEVPASRLNAIRAVLAGSGRRPNSVAEFLDAAGLALTGPRATLRRPELPLRSRSLWRLVASMAAVAALVTMAALYYDGVAASAEELKVRGLDALRAVAAHVAPPESTPTETEPSADDPTLHRTTETPREPGAAARETPPHGAQPKATTPPRQPASTAAARPTATPPPAPQREPAVLSLDVPRIAAREDHTFVAIDIVRTGDTTHEATVGWWTTPDTAHEEDDYAHTGRQTVTFPPGATVERVLIPIVDDGVREQDETFTVHLGNPSGGIAGAVTTTRVTLHDDD